jgi:hypothetical protein
MNTITLGQLFRGHDDVLVAAMNDTLAGRRATDIAGEHIEPILEDLCRNAGQQMDPVYVAYMLQAAKPAAEARDPALD